jgi:hypothetical protein
MKHWLGYLRAVVTKGVLMWRVRTKMLKIAHGNQATMSSGNQPSKSHIDAMKGRYLHDISIVRARGDNTAPAPEVDEVVVYRSFMKAGL